MPGQVTIEMAGNENWMANGILLAWGAIRLTTGISTQGKDPSIFEPIGMRVLPGTRQVLTIS